MIHIEKSTVNYAPESSQASNPNLGENPEERAGLPTL